MKNEGPEAQMFQFTGKSVPRLDAVEKATGTAKFLSDMKMDTMLHARILRSRFPHARIVNLDITRANKLPGVRAILTSRDIPALSIAPHLGDQYALCRDNVVRCVGDPIAAVAADTIETAEEALVLIRVDYEEMAPAFDGQGAAATSPSVVVHPRLSEYEVLSGVPVHPDPARPNVCQTFKVCTGDVEKGFLEADLVIENTFSTARIQHCQMETSVALAWFEPDGSLSVRSSSQMVYDLRSRICKVLGLPPSKVRVLSTYIGGGQGGKVGVTGEVIAALLARKSGRPVSLAYTREEMFGCGGHRVPFTISIKDGVNKDGTLVAREIKALLAIGLYSDKGVLIARKAPGGAKSVYKIPHFQFDSYAVYTNLPPTTALRGFGSPEVLWAIEQQMDIIAEKLKMDPVALRKKNIMAEGSQDVSGMVIRNIGVGECLTRVAQWIGWGQKPAVDGGPWKRGKGIAIGCKPTIAGTSSVVIVKVWHDGVIEVRYSAMELGQGIKTTLAQIAADQFGIPITQVKMVSGDTDSCPYDFGTVSSRSLIHNGNALVAACRDARRQLFELAAPRLGAWNLELKEGKIHVREAPEMAIAIKELFNPFGLPLAGGEIIGRGIYTAPMVAEDPVTGHSERSAFSYSYIASAVEVAVSTETGEVKVLKSCVACDVGRAINPVIVQGQVEGGDTMGIGSALYEEVAFDGHGAVANASFRDYRIPGPLDLPREEDRKTVIVETLEPEGPFGAKGVGELPLAATAPAIANAIYNAIGVRIKSLPITREKVLAALRSDRT